MTRNPVGDNEAFSAAYWSAKANAHGGEAVVSGLDPSKGTGNYDVDTAEGEIQVGSRAAFLEPQTTTVAAADATNPRVDIITADLASNVTVTEGVPSPNPAAPDIPDDEVLICAVFVPGGASQITASDIHDYRIILDLTRRVVQREDFIAQKMGMRPNPL